MNSIKLIEKIRSGKRIYGTAIVSPSMMWPAALKNAGLDFVFIDTEHIAFDRETVAYMCNVYSAIGLPPIVRIPSPDPYAACTTLDAGAAGILAPYIETVEQVKRLVGAIKYRPIKGEKLDMILNDSGKMDKNLKEYINARCRNNMFFINIESVPAFEKLDELLGVPGIDGVIIGPHDLSCSMDLPEEYNNQVFEKSVSKIIQACKKRDLGVGIHLSEEPEQQIKWGERGVNIILHSSDISLFRTKLLEDMDKIKNGLDDFPVNKENNTIII